MAIKDTIKDYVNLAALKTFLDNARELFATKEETSSAVTEVNKRIDTAETNLQNYTDTALENKSQVQIITWEAGDQ